MDRLTGVLFLAVVAVWSGCATTPAMKPAGPAAQGSAQSVEEAWGIRVKAIRLTADGHMLDFRYVVLDPAKAKPLSGQGITPYLLDQETGARFDMPMTNMGAMRSGSKNVDPGKTYFIAFLNPGKYVKKGSKVTVVIGDFKVENLVVE